MDGSHARNRPHQAVSLAYHPELPHLFVLYSVKTLPVWGVCLKVKLRTFHTTLKDAVCYEHLRAVWNAFVITVINLGAANSKKFLEYAELTKSLVRDISRCVMKRIYNQTSEKEKKRMSGRIRK